jgi:cellulase
MALSTLLTLALAGAHIVNAQASGSADAHPGLTTYKCTTAGGCVSQKTSVVIDYQYHWIHSPTGTQASCTTNSGVDSSLCPDQATCDKNCVIDGQL